MELEHLLILVAAGVAAGTYLASLRLGYFGTVKYLTRLLGQQYGFVRSVYEITYEIQADGSANINYRERFKVINGELSGVEHYTTIATSPTDMKERFKVDAAVGQAKGQEIEILPKLILNAPNHLYYQLLFSPPLKRGLELEYTYKVQCPPKTFVRSSEELSERSLPFDYVSIEVAYPTEALVLKLIFFDNPVEIEYDVWMGDARLRLKKEFRRLDEIGAKTIERGSDQHLFAQLKVEYPVLGLQYALTWKPTSK